WSAPRPCWTADHRRRCAAPARSDQDLVGMPRSQMLMDRRATRLTGLGTTVFTEMTALAARTGAINLGQGFPDTDGPPAVIEAAVEALRAGENQYPPLPGAPVLREAVLEHQQRCYGL